MRGGGTSKKEEGLGSEDGVIQVPHWQQCDYMMQHQENLRLGEHFHNDHEVSIKHYL